MEPTMYISLSTKNLDVLNRICLTEYDFNNETDFDLYSFDNHCTIAKLAIIFKGIYLLEANNFIVLIKTGAARYLLSYPTNEYILPLLGDQGYIEYLSDDMAIIWLRNTPLQKLESINKQMACLGMPVEFTQAKQGRRKA